MKWNLPQRLSSELIAKALGIQKFAYSPYSQHQIGSLVFGLDLSGNSVIAVGANVEFVSYGLTLCAESVALTQAVAKGMRELLFVVCIGHSAKIQTVCGACRQRIAEFVVDEPVWLISTAKNGKPYKITRIDQEWDDLVPHHRHSSNPRRFEYVARILNQYK